MQAARAIMVGDGEVFIAGGIESMTHVPMGSDINPNPKIFNIVDNASFFMGQTAEILAERWKISRREQDEFALWSHQKAIAAQDAGKFKKQIVPVEGEKEDGTKFIVDRDQCPRRDTSLEKLASLKLAFRPEGKGCITAGNSSPLNDGAAMVLMMSEKKAKELGLKILASIKSMAVAGVPPEIMGTGPIPATRKALKRANLELKDLDVIEINEAFAVVPIVCCQELGISKEEQQKKLNPCGGAVAIGHPLGASGARIVTDLLYEMERRDAKYGLATMCVGMGEGAAIIFERG
jgi:acetyl-CoA acyltransferase